MSTAVTTTFPAHGVALATWASLANGEAGSPISLPRYPDKTFQISGTFGAGGSVNIEGSNDGSNWNILADINGNALTRTASGVDTISDNPFYIRANCTAGDGTTNLKVTILCVQAV